MGGDDKMHGDDNEGGDDKKVGMIIKTNHNKIDIPPLAKGRAGWGCILNELQKNRDHRNENV